MNFIPIIKSLKNYSREDFTGDISAGFTIAVLLIPQAMAYAMIAGLPPVTGLYSSIIPLAIYAIFGTSGQLSVGPVAIVSILVASSLGEMQLTAEEYLSCAIILSLMTGAILFILGILKIGFLDNFLSHSMITGYTGAAAIIIGMSQLKHLTGIKLQDHDNIFHTLYEFITRINEVNPHTLIIGLISMGIIYGLKKINNKIPCALISILFAMGAVYFTDLSGKVAVIGDIPGGLPGFKIPAIPMNLLSSFFGVAMTISIVGFMESISVAKAMATKTRTRVDANQELIALGLANLGGSFFQSYPVTGGFSRTAVNYEGGARTGVASIITATAIALSLIFFTTYLYHIPKTSLAAIIMIAVAGLIDVKGMKHTFKVKKKDGYILLIAFFATLFIGVEQGILTGVVSSLALFIWRTVRPHMAVLGKMSDGDDIYRNIERYPEAITWPHICILRMDASLYFANAKFLESKVIQLLADNKEARYFILDGSGINDIDASAEETLRQLAENLKNQKCEFYITSLKGPVRDILRNSGFYSFLGEEHFFETISQAIDKVNNNPNLDNIMNN